MGPNRQSPQLRMSGKAAQQLGYAPKSVEEQAAEREAKERERVEREARATADREERAERRALLRQRIERERAEANAADGLLQTALDAYREVEKAIDPKERERARRMAEDALRAFNTAEEVLRLAQQTVIEAARTRDHMQAKHAQMEALAGEKLPAAKASLRQAWHENDETWHKQPPAYRKKHRDRPLKNAVKIILGFKGDN